MTNNKMKEKNPLYDWHFLETYVKERLQGNIVESYEWIIREDDFLQTVVVGMEESILERTEEKKRRIWKQMEAHIPSVLATSDVQQVEKQNQYSFDLGQNLLRIWNELKYAQFHYILGFNFSCVFLILALCFWINTFPEEVPMISQIEFPGGFKQ